MIAIRNIDTIVHAFGERWKTFILDMLALPYLNWHDSPVPRLCSQKNYGMQNLKIFFHDFTRKGQHFCFIQSWHIWKASYSILICKILQDRISVYISQWKFGNNIFEVVVLDKIMSVRQTMTISKKLEAGHLSPLH